jgi:hypothetical protein
MRRPDFATAKDRGHELFVFASRLSLIPLFSPNAMTIRRFAAALAAVLGCAFPAAAQPAPPTTPASLDGMAFPVVSRFQPVPALSDANLAVFADTRARTAVFVATVPQGTHRTDAMARARENAARAALGGEPRPIEWHSVPSLAVSGDEVYHECRLAHDGASVAVVQLRRLRSGGRDVITGYAFRLSREDAPRALSMSMFTPWSEPAAEASGLIVAALAGEPPVKDYAEAPSPHSPSPEEPAVRAAYDALIAASTAREHEAVPALVAQPYLEYLDDMRHLALNAPAARVRAEPMMSRMYVLGLRHLVPAAELGAMDARQLLSRLWGTGWLGTGWGGPNSRGLAAEKVVVVEGDLAFAQTPSRGGRSGAPGLARMLRNTFRREDGAWKVDVLGGIFALESTMRTTADGLKGAGEDRALLVLLERLSGRPVASTVWDPPAAP